ncbi:hypothetical protein [Nocardia tengchongensis]|uniref:hypothetical protein n=1 Tax=Nocardia tengchongensis TaxID=2055889 RepID=UPI00369CE417
MSHFEVIVRVDAGDEFRDDSGCGLHDGEGYAGRPTDRDGSIGWLLVSYLWIGCPIVLDASARRSLVKRFAAVLTVGIAAVAGPVVAAGIAGADVWEPAPGISIPLPDGMFTGSAGVRSTPVPTPDPGPDRVEGAPCDDGRGTWVHLDPGNAAHYGTDWLCRAN